MFTCVLAVFLLVTSCVNELWLVEIYLFKGEKSLSEDLEILFTLGAIALLRDEMSDEKHEKTHRVSSCLIEKNPTVFEPLLFSTNSVRVQITDLMLYDDPAQANHFNLLLPRGGFFNAPLQQNTAVSVPMDLDNTGNSYLTCLSCYM